MLKFFKTILTLFISFTTIGACGNKNNISAIGDKITIDFQAFDDHEPVPGIGQDGYVYRLGSEKYFSSDFEQALVGYKVGEVNEVTVTFPEGHPIEKVKGKKIVFKVKYQKITKGKPAKKGDVAVIDYTGYLDGEAFENGSDKNYPLKLGSNQFISGFEEQIIGRRVGETFDIKVVFPKQYYAKKLAGKETVFKIKLKDLNP